MHRKKPEVPAAISEEVQEVVKNFRSIADETSGPVRIYLKKARLSLGGENRLMIVLPDEMGASVVGSGRAQKGIGEFDRAKDREKGRSGGPSDGGRPPL